LLTADTTSSASGWLDADGGLNGEDTSPERRVTVVTGAETSVQLASTPLHEGLKTRIS
jgi:hypothetical protein